MQSYDILFFNGVEETVDSLPHESQRQKKKVKVRSYIFIGLVVAGELKKTYLDLLSLYKNL